RTALRTRGSAERAPRERPDRRRLPVLRPSGPRAPHAARSPDARSRPRASPPRSARRSPRQRARVDPRARRGAPRAECGPRTAPPARLRLASSVARARERRDEQRDVVVALLERDLELDAGEEGRRRTEDDAVAAGLEARGELVDAAVGVGRPGGDVLRLAPQLHLH